MDWPSNRVDGGQPLSRRDRKRPGATLIASLLESTVEKSSVGQCMKRPYRKPTQVGEASSLR